jgi:hypothetical protein
MEAEASPCRAWTTPPVTNVLSRHAPPLIGIGERGNRHRKVTPDGLGRRHGQVGVGPRAEASAVRARAKSMVVARSRAARAASHPLQIVGVSGGLPGRPSPRRGCASRDGAPRGLGLLRGAGAGGEAQQRGALVRVEPTLRPARASTAAAASRRPPAPRTCRMGCAKYSASPAALVTFTTEARASRRAVSGVTGSPWGAAGRRGRAGDGVDARRVKQRLVALDVDHDVGVRGCTASAGRPSPSRGGDVRTTRPEAPDDAAMRCRRWRRAPGKGSFAARASHTRSIIVLPWMSARASPEGGRARRAGMIATMANAVGP